MSEHKHAFV